MTPTERHQKIEAAKKITAAFLPFHKMHLEDGYIEATESDMVELCNSGHFTGWVMKDFHVGINYRSTEKHIWAIDSKSRLVMV